jgi:hypothetical protein
MLEEKAQDVMINMRGLLPMIVSNALNVLGAILILLIGLWLGAERGDHDRTVDADSVHRSDHLFACGGVESVRWTGSRPPDDFDRRDEPERV